MITITQLTCKDRLIYALESGFQTKVNQLTDNKRNETVYVSQIYSFITNSRTSAHIDCHPYPNQNQIIFDQFREDDILTDRQAPFSLLSVK